MSESAGARPSGAASSSLRWAGVLLVVGTLEFVVGMVVAQIGYGSAYSLSNNLISDLGVTACGVVDGTGRYACSPWWYVFDGTLVVFGAMITAGLLRARSAFGPARFGSLGAALLVVNALGVLAAGAIPENVGYAAHSAFALIAFAAGSVGLIVVAIGLYRAPEFGPSWAAYSTGSGVVGVIALALFIGGNDVGLGAGGMERLIVAPILLWFLLCGAQLLRASVRPASVTPSPSKP
ncbi:MAG TPA: DUF998 domain-containing protein [Thermoplasmata archaeon]|nr:DUF998 domain-containing protein [Thermoplasmata archaeon]